MSLATVVRVSEVLPHKNADHLEIVPIGEHQQTIITKGQFQPGDLGILILPTAIVAPLQAFNWLWKSSNKAAPTWSHFTRQRTIGVRRFRGEPSHALLMHPSELGELIPEYTDGADVSSTVLETAMPRDSQWDTGWGFPKCHRQHLPRSLKSWFNYLRYRWHAA